MNVATGPTRLVIVGATGMVGGYALRYALAHPAVGRVTAIGRRKLGISHPKLNDVLHRDFADCSALAEALSGQDAAVFCLGVYRSGAGSGAPQNNRGLLDRVRASSPQQPSRRGVLIPERGVARTRRDEVGWPWHAIRERPRRHSSRGVPSRLPLSARVHLSRGAAEGTKFQLSPITRNLPRVSGSVPQPGDSGRRLGPGHGGRCCPSKR
jgi:hypothetical protein